MYVLDEIANVKQQRCLNKLGREQHQDKSGSRGGKHALHFGISQGCMMIITACAMTVDLPRSRWPSDTCRVMEAKRSERADYGEVKSVFRS